MCGIVGIVHTDTQKAVDPRQVERMAEVLAHRGPDDAGVWTGGHVGLGHRRLSIIDLQGGHQPMAADGGRVWITYNGEIYNYIELRRDLAARGFACSSQSDTEVLLQSFVADGDACLDALNGMFSFAVWDGRERSLFAARDRFGIKPFYYFWDGESFVFASEIKSLLLHPGVRAAVDYDALDDYLDLQYCLGDKTLFAGVKRLEPGHALRLQDGRLRVWRYWDMVFGEAAAASDPDEAVEELRALCEDAVRLRLRSDVPVGSHLSGGLDSSAIAAIAAPRLEGRLQVFTGGFKERSKYDESSYARLVAERVGAEYHEVFPQSSDLADTFADLVYYLDEPIAGAAVLPQYFVSKLASSRVKVVLGGQGADEVFCGYARYLVAYLESGLQQAVYGEGEAPAADLARMAANLPYLRGYEPMMMGFFGSDLFGDPAARYFRLLRRSENMDSILQRPRGGDYSTAEAFRAEFERPDSQALIDRMTYMDTKNHLQSLLQLEDRTSMAVSLESRLPLLDYRLVERALAVPAAGRFADGRPKHLFRRAVEHAVPPEIMQRRDKMGFPVPIFEWFNGPLKGFVEDILLGATTRQRGFFRMDQVEACLRAEKPFGRTVWGLLSLELWFRRFFDGGR